MEENIVENHEKIKITINLMKANIWGIFSGIPIIFIYLLPFYLVWHNHYTIDYFIHLAKSSVQNGFYDILIVFIIFTLGVLAHELIHGITWAFFAKKGFKSIRFGILWQMLTPYCHCKEPLLLKHYLLGAIMPALILGIFPAIYAITTGSLGYLLFGFFFTLVAVGDFMIIFLLRKENPNVLVQDHPSEAGCFVYRKKEEI